MSAFVPSVPVPTCASWSSSVSAPPRPSTSPAPARLRAPCVRMVAAEPTSKSKSKSTSTSTSTSTPTPTEQVPISLNALALISFIRGHKSIFFPGDGFCTTSRMLCMKNDTARLFTPQDQLDTNRPYLPGHSVAGVIVANADALIDAGVDAAATRCDLVAQHDVINDIVQYNVSAALRAVSYGAAAQSTHFMHLNNVGMMRDLHEDIGLPADAVAIAMDTMRDLVVADVDDEQLKKGTADCFDTLRDALC